MWKRTATIIMLIVVMLCAAVCSPGGNEPGQVSLPVVTDSSEIKVCENAQGWTVELTAFRIAARNLEFTIEGETHARLLPSLSDFLIPNAFAHPGHYAGGDVTGELPGDFLIDLFDQKEQDLGEADLLEGEYNGINLYFRKAVEADGLDKDDPLLGHTAYLAGIATKGAESIEFTAVLDELEENTQMVGGPFELVVSSDTLATLALQARTVDASEGDTLFDGLDFDELDDDNDGVLAISPGDEAHNILMKTLQRHDHYAVVVL